MRETVLNSQDHFWVEDGTLLIGGMIGNTPATLSNGTMIQMRHMNTSVPLLRLEALTGELTEEIPLYIQMAEEDQLSAQCHKLIQLNQWMTKDLFEIHFVPDWENSVDIDPESYIVDYNEKNVLQIKSVVKVWSGTSGGAGIGVQIRPRPLGIMDNSHLLRTIRSALGRSRIPILWSPLSALFGQRA